MKIIITRPEKETDIRGGSVSNAYASHALYQRTLLRQTVVNTDSNSSTAKRYPACVGVTIPRR